MVMCIKNLLTINLYSLILLFIKIEINFPDFKVLEFNYQVIQLNRLNWRDFLDKPNPVASALMAKMDIAPKDRPKVKALYAY